MRRLLFDKLLLQYTNYRKRITYKQLSDVFAWYLLAKGIKSLVTNIESSNSEKRYFIEYKNI